MVKNQALLFLRCSLLSLRGAKRRSNQVRLPRLLLRRSLAMTINLPLQRPNLSVIASLTALAVRRGNLGSQTFGFANCVGEANLGLKTFRFSNCVGEANLVFNEKGRIRLPRLPFGKARNGRGVENATPPFEKPRIYGYRFSMGYFLSFTIFNSPF